MQDGAPAHRAKDTIKLLEDYFGNLIAGGTYHGAPHPANSPDFNPLDYYFWSAMKGIV